MQKDASAALKMAKANSNVEWKQEEAPFNYAVVTVGGKENKKIFCGVVEFFLFIPFRNVSLKRGAKKERVGDFFKIAFSMGSCLIYSISGKWMQFIQILSRFFL